MTDIVLVAPYIKRAPLERVFAAIPPAVRTVTCVTRWLPEDIAAGVCDLEILDIVAGRQGATLYVHPHLHAKFFRAGETCLVGSANLTLRALGWVTPANLELLVALRSDHPGIQEWEAALMLATIPVTSELRDRIAAQAQLLAGSFPREAYTRTEAPEIWIPSCPVPDRLWLVYCGRGADTMVTSAFHAAQADLAILSIPAGLSEPLFSAYVAATLRSMPIFKEIEVRATAGLTDNQAQELLAQRVGASLPSSHEQIWRTLKAWIGYFFRASYRFQVEQEMLIKGQTLHQAE
ncbi:MAG: phospholipase D family protein [Hyphomonadaceae bacterium]|nr:phospholipase D family protein [Hyphomonadaceae bacterium]